MIAEKQAADESLSWVAVSLASCVFVIGVFLRWHHLFTPSLSLDEAYTTLQIRLSWSELLSLAPYEPNPMGGLFVYKLWNMLGADRIGNLELLSFVAGCVGLLLFLRFASGILRSHQALLATLFLAVSSLHIHFSQQVRTYALAAVFLLLAAMYFRDYVLHARGRVPFVLSAGALALCHYIPWLVLATWSFVGLLWVQRERRKEYVLSWVWVGVICLPQAVALFQQFFFNPYYQSFPSPRVAVFEQILFAFGLSSQFFAPLMLGSIFALIVIRMRDKNWNFEDVWLLSWLLAPLALNYLVSFLGEPFFNIRYSVFCLFPFLILSVRLFDQYGRVWMKAGVAVVALLCSVSPLEFYYEERQRYVELHREMQEFGDRPYFLSSSTETYIAALAYRPDLSDRILLLPGVEVPPVATFLTQEERHVGSEDLVSGFVAPRVACAECRDKAELERKYHLSVGTNDSVATDCRPELPLICSMKRELEDEGS